MEYKVNKIEKRKRRKAYMTHNEELRHVAGVGIGYLLVKGNLLEREDLTPLEKLVLTYDETNETPDTSDASCAENLGVTREEITKARDHLASLGEYVEPHRHADLTEEEYYV